MDVRDTGNAATRTWHAALYALLVLTFVTGGSSQEHGWTDVGAQLLALPVLLVALLRLPELPSSPVRSLGLAALAAVVLLPWLQLLPLPQAAWQLAPARAALAADLATAGVAQPALRWSLTPHATLQGALALLPATALFLGALGVGTRTQRRLLVLCVALPLASLLLGFLQLGAAQDSLLNPYPQWAPAMNGTFANPNHQGTAMLVGLGICLAFVVAAFVARAEHDAPSNPWPAIIAGTFLLLGLPLTNSRASVIIGVLLLVAAPLAMASGAMRRSGRGRYGILALGIAGLLVAIGLYAAAGWMKVDEIEEFRSIMRQATIALAATHLPWGSGVGSFVPVFQQAFPDSLLMRNYINAAHNDFAQAWLEIGVAGLAVASLAAVAIAAALRGQLRAHAGDRRLVWASLLGIFAILVASIADYPLRTPAILALAAVLCGVLFAQASRPGGTDPGPNLR